MSPKKDVDTTLSSACYEVEDREPQRPVWWRGPTKTTGLLSPRELREMANADCRFLDEEAS